MRFWDASALVPLLVRETKSQEMQEVYAADEDVLAWWATEVECASALARRGRLGAPRREIEDGFARLAAIVPRWTEVGPGQLLRQTARRLVRVHDLRAADAFQLAAALTAATGLEIVTLDDKLALAARLEGFAVLGV